MKKIILTFALIASLSVSLTSCSADDSDINSTSADQLTQPGNGLPKPSPIQP